MQPVSERLHSACLPALTHLKDDIFEAILLREWEAALNMDVITAWMEETIFDAAVDQNGFCLKCVHVVEHLLFRATIDGNISDYVLSSQVALDLTLIVSVLGGGDGGSLGRRDFTHFTLGLLDTWHASVLGHTVFRDSRPNIFHNLMGVRQHEKRALDSTVEERARQYEEMLSTTYQLQVPGASVVHKVQLRIADAARADTPYLGQIMGVRFLNSLFKSPVDGSHSGEINDRDPVISKVLSVGDREALYLAKEEYMRLEMAKLPATLGKTERGKKERELRGIARGLFCNSMHRPDVLATTNILSEGTVKQMREVTARHDPLHGKSNTIRRWWYLCKSLASNFEDSIHGRIPLTGTASAARDSLTSALKKTSPGSNRAVDDLFGVDWEKFLRLRETAVRPWCGDIVCACGDVLELAVSLLAAGRGDILQADVRAMRAFVTLWHAEVFPALLGCTAPTGKFSEVAKFRCIHNQGFSLMPPAHSCGADDTAQHTERAVKQKRQSLKACGGSSKSALDQQHVHNSAIQHEGHGTRQNKHTEWPSAILIPWCAVYFRRGTHSRYHATEEQLDKEAREFVFWNKERPGILIVRTDEARAKARADVAWGGGADAKVLCCGKHKGKCEHGTADARESKLTLATYLEPPFGFLVPDIGQRRQQLMDLGFFPLSTAAPDTPKCKCLGGNAPLSSLIDAADIYARPWFGSDVMEWYKSTGVSVPSGVLKIRKAYEQAARCKGMPTLPDQTCVADVIEEAEDEDGPILVSVCKIPHIFSSCTMLASVCVNMCV